MTDTTDSAALGKALKDLELIKNTKDNLPSVQAEAIRAAVAAGATWVQVAYHLEMTVQGAQKAATK